MSRSSAQPIRPIAAPRPVPLNAYWMPFTGNRSFKKDPRIIVEAQGAYFTDDRGRRILDGLSGLWCSGLGHCRPEITEAVLRRQFGGYTDDNSKFDTAGCAGPRLDVC